MGVIGGIVSGATALAGGIAGGIAGRKAAKKNRRILNNMRSDSQNWYDREYNADFLQRSDAQSALNKAREILNNRYKYAQGAAAVGGATEESIAQQKEAANKTLADITGNIAERADAYKEQVRANYENQQNTINQLEMGMNDRKASNIAQAAGGISQAGMGLGSVISDDLLKKK